MLAEKAYEPIDKEVLVVAEKVGFEPTVPCGTPDFESGTFDHSAISPNWNFTLMYRDLKLGIYLPS